MCKTYFVPTPYGTSDHRQSRPNYAAPSRLGSDYDLDVTTMEPPEFDPRWLEAFLDQAAFQSHIHAWPMGEAIPQCHVD